MSNFTALCHLTRLWLQDWCS